MDRAVLDAYGWTDIDVPTYGTPVTAEERRALERFEDVSVSGTMQLKLHPNAEEDLLHDAAWYDERRVGLGDAFLEYMCLGTLRGKSADRSDRRRLDRRPR